MMKLLIEIVVVLLKTVYLWIKAIVLACVPVSYRSKDIAGETVLVTGAGSGLGRLLSIRFARRGCRLVLWDINSQGMAETADMLRKLGVVPSVYTVDLSKREDIYDVADQVKRDVGEIDILVNNAGIVTGHKFLQCSDEMIEKTMAVNAMAHFWTVKSFIPGMMERNHGHIVSIASGAGHFGMAGLADYCASKFAAVGFDESLRMELEVLGKTGVHTTCICPYYINTGMFDGVQSRFPRLLPILDQDYAADSIMSAVLTNKAMLMMPSSLYMTLALKGIMPISCAQLLGDFTGVSHSMDTFRGRQKKE